MDYDISLILVKQILMKSWTNLLNLAKFVSWQSMAVHGHFHRHQLFAANYFFTRPVLSYLAVSTATWEH